MDEDDVTSDTLPAFLYPEWPDATAETEPAESPGMPRRTIALIASGGVALLLMIGLVGAALTTTGDDGTSRPAAAPRNTNGPVVPVVPVGSPPPEPSLEPPPPSDAASPSPSASKKATKSPTPTKASTPPKATVTAASISMSPSSYEGSCKQGGPTTMITLHISVSVPNSLVQWRVNGVADKAVVQGTTYTTSWPVQANRTYKATLSVTAPTTADDTATFTVRCRN